MTLEGQSLSLRQDRQRSPRVGCKLPPAPPLPRSFYDRDPVAVARDLLGMLIVRVTPEGLTAGRIVEVEAYLASGDPANHAYRGKTRRNASMFGPPGHAYVYAIHSRWCLNAVTEPEGVPSAVLIRAVEPLEGFQIMQLRRGRSELRELARGPARLCEAFAIDRTLNGWDLTLGQQLWIGQATVYPESTSPTRCRATTVSSFLPPDRAPQLVHSGSASDLRIMTAARVGITTGKELPLRFFLADNPFVSKPGRRPGIAPR